QNVELWLYDDIGSGYSHHDPLWEAVTAGTNGAYSFSNICCGTYRLAVHTNPYYPGSINATDAYQVQYWCSGLVMFMALVQVFPMSRSILRMLSVSRHILCMAAIARVQWVLVLTGLHGHMQKQV
ncbi:MAG: hypothetical protein NTX61_14565, partial [Bacteroidetes bacterium]|nr:hypothetical protein [Bacteroidota bacterium]